MGKKVKKFICFVSVFASTIAFGSPHGGSYYLTEGKDHCPSEILMALDFESGEVSLNDSIGEAGSGKFTSHEECQVDESKDEHMRYCHYARFKESEIILTSTQQGLLFGFIPGPMYKTTLDLIFAQNYSVLTVKFDGNGQYSPRGQCNYKEK